MYMHRYGVPHVKLSFQNVHDYQGHLLRIAVAEMQFCSARQELINRDWNGPTPNVRCLNYNPFCDGLRNENRKKVIIPEQTLKYLFFKRLFHSNHVNERRKLLASCEINCVKAKDSKFLSLLPTADKCWKCQKFMLSRLEKLKESHKIKNEVSRGYTVLKVIRVLLGNW